MHIYRKLHTYIQGSVYGEVIILKATNLELAHHIKVSTVKKSTMLAEGKFILPLIWNLSAIDLFEEHFSGKYTLIL